ncbi:MULTISPECIES: photosynthetic complex putative assembly protein PuhB [Thiorhodovibrio]|uniref:photosynthetic complex putative assembly protein PuhB n=1 Tax=Thiorhodovibrio TaxID=61593 RepID=UPI00191151EB|nr:photosynthetic complex putative assembly protein PuhB [Thiorhodovibrio litoralis]MBK5968646.1 phosphopantetheine adenylyltransferase [Thiorhodovibrio winogradskyi]WPL10995.1 PH domain-containing protein [Thiorhodovibrio litoralis]
MSEYEVEPIPGLPGLLPEGEELLWQGTPQWVPLAKRAFHVRGVLFYFGLLVLLRVGFILTEGEGWGLALQSALWLAFLAFAAVGILSLLAWLYARSTIYSITSRRVVIRSGVVVPMAVNLPFKSIESAGLRVYSDGAGDIPLALIPEQKVNYLIVWPNVRPWTFSKAQPMLRALPDVEKTAELLAHALKAATEAESAEVAQDQSSQPSGSATTQSREAIRESTESSDAGASSAGEPLPTTPSS